MKNSLKEFDCWLSSSSYSTIYPGKRLLKISTDLKFGQRGLIACSEIKAGQCIYSIPLNDLRFILTPLRCTHLFNTRCQCFNDTEQIKITLNSIDILVAFIYHCKYTTSTECCLRNIWAPYISILPETYSDPLSCILSNYNHLYENIFIDSSNYFHSTDLNISLKRLLIRLLKSWNRIQPFINKSHTQSVYNIHKKCYSLPPNEFLWAWCTVNSRCVSCPFKESMTSVEQLCQTMFNCEQFCLNNMHISHIKDNLHDNGYTIAVIPFFDFFNHNQNVSTSMSVSKDGNTLELCIDRQISADEQVFINYGPHDNLTLFTEYGFSLPFHENDNDVIYLSFYFLMDLFVKLSTAMTSSSSSTSFHLEVSIS
ncbi:unnamed protein product [Heterobilharzia americana]|nr:unnamed protein product [Heterobilharzia americana]